MNSGFKGSVLENGARKGDRGAGAAGKEFVDLNRFFLAVRRQMPVIGYGAVLGFALSMFLGMTEIPKYEAVESILMNEERAELLDMVSAVPFAALTDSAVQSEVEIIKSSALAIEVVKNLNLVEDLDFMEPPVSIKDRAMGNARAALRSLIKTKSEDPVELVEDAGSEEQAKFDSAVETLRSNLEVDRVARSFVIELIYTDHDPARAARIARAYGNAYTRFQVNSNFEAASGAGKWLEERLQQLEEQSLEAAVEIAQFRRENDLTDSGVIGQLAQLEQRAASYMEMYLDFLSRYELARQQSSFPVASVEILSRATEPESPSSPRKMRMGALGLILGALVGAIIASIKEIRSKSLRNRYDVADELGLNFIGFTPDAKAYSRGWIVRPFLRAIGFRRLFAKKEAAQARDSEYIVDQTLSSLLVTAGFPISHQTNWVAIASVEPLTHRPLAERFADLISGTGEKTLFIDASTANQPAEIGEARSKNAAQIEKRKDRSDLLSLRNSSEAGALLSSLRIGSPSRDFENAFKGYDRVVLLAPPILKSRLLSDIAGQMNAVFLFAEWGRTSAKLMSDLMEFYPSTYGRLSGVVLCGGNLAEIRRSVPPKSLDAEMLTTSLALSAHPNKEQPT